MPSTDLTLISSPDSLLRCIFLVAIALASLRLLPVILIPEMYDTALGTSTAVGRGARILRTEDIRYFPRWTPGSWGYQTNRTRDRARREAGETGEGHWANVAVSSGIHRPTMTNDGANLEGGDTSVEVEDHTKIRGFGAFRRALK